MKRRKRKPFSTEDFILTYRWLRPEYRDGLLASAKPHSLCGARLPDNLNLLTLDQLEDITLAVARPMDEAVFAICHVVLGVDDRREILKSPAADVCGFVRFVTDECNRISGLFSKISRQHTADEKAAGIETLKFGMFGLVDWYAQRMGIQDHNQAKQTPWVRVYECSRMDFLTSEYQRKLMEIERRKTEAKARKR